MEQLNEIQSEVEFEDTNDNKSPTEISYLDYNELDFTTEADTVCDMCSAEFLDASDLQTHLREVHLKGEQSQRYCTFCLKIFPDVENFMLHIRNEHLLHLKWCVHCYRLFPNLETKMAHENKHKYRPKHSIFCSQCNKCFAYDFDISQHEYEEHQNCEGVMINHGFSLLSSLLNMNVKSFFGTLPKNYICICRSQYQSMHSYIDHLKRSSCKSYTCDLCCKVYSRKSRLFKHVNMHTLKKRNNSQCSKCNRHFSFRALKEHKKTCFLIKCSDCNLEFDTIQELGNHRTETHKGTVTLTRCKLCDRQFVGDDTLINHVKKVHQNNLHLYKYLCVYCDRIFKHPKLLFGHFFSTHKDLSPYTCKICNTQFRIRKKFTLHVRTEHKNVGFVEFDEKFNVYFVEKKSDNPFIPQSIYYESLKDENINNSVSDIETKQLKTGIRQKAITIQEMHSDSSDSDAPLLKICKKPLRRRKKKKFMCEVCNKNCFTLQNFRHHMNLHVKMQPIHCIKCDQSFKSEKSLKRHLKENHKNSKLIETLQKIKERKKSVAPAETPIEQNFKSMKLTLKKVEPDQSPPAILKMVKSGKKLSVQNFFETFKPDQNEKVKIESSVTMKMTTERKKMNIFLKKCNNVPLIFKGLKVPQKFVGCNEEPSTVTIKIVEGETKHANLNYGDRVYKQADVITMEADHAYCEEYIFTEVDQSNEDFIGEEKTNIPEVAEEIMLSSEEFQPLQQKFVIPDMPEAIKSFRIGTLQAEAPFYKIIKLEDIVQTEERQKTPEKKVVKVSDGLQLVPVNPLAHLIKEEDIHKKKQNKNYYKPIERDIKEAIKKAMAVKTIKKPKKKVKSKTCADRKTTKNIST